MFHPVTDGVGLKKLGSIYQGRKVVRVFVGLLEVIHDLSVCRVISLMFLHYIGENIPVLRVVADPFLYSFYRREGLETKFGKIAEAIFPILREGLVPMPYLPEMYVPRFGS